MTKPVNAGQPVINGHTRWAGVVGWPVSHSRSPLIHNYWCGKYGVDAVYLPLPVMPDALPQVIPALVQMGCAGVNLTLPHKELVLPLLDVLDPFAQKIGAVNTVVMRDNTLHGYNTDAYGFWQNIRSHTPALQCSRAFVVGAGGAARAVVAALDNAEYEVIYVMNRTLEKAIALQDVSRKVQAVEWMPAAGELQGCDMLVNTTCLGMDGQPPLELALGMLAPDAVVADIVYTPLETPLLAAAKRLGLQTVDGLGMLLYQAQKAFELWFGVLPEVDDTLRRAVLQEHT